MQAKLRPFMRSSRRLSGLLLSSLLAGVVTTQATAAPFPPRAERLTPPGKSASLDDGADSILVNPAGLAQMESWEARALAIGCHDAPQRTGCGGALSIATPLFFGLSVGARLDAVFPPNPIAYPFGGSSYFWGTFALSAKLSERFSMGFSYQRSHSRIPGLSDLWGVSFGLRYTPSPRFSLGLVANDFNGPQSGALPAYSPLDRSYVASVGFRPTGRREFEVGVDLRYLERTELALPRLFTAFDIPGFGRARGDVEFANLANDSLRSYIVTAGLEIAWERMTLGGGILVGNGLGGAAGFGEYFTASISGARSPGLARPTRAVSLRIEKTPGSRSHIALLQKLWTIAEDPSVEAVAMIARAEPASSFAHAEELVDAFRVLRARGKKILCSLEDNGARSLYVCANADRTVINPAGGIRFAGLRSQYFYIANMMEKLGIRADILKISDHKAAPEMFTNTAASETAKADHIRALAQVEDVYYKNLAQGRKMTEADARQTIAKGPFVAKEAREMRLVDGYAFDDQVDDVLTEMVGHKVRLQKYEEDTLAPDTFGPRGKVGLLLVDGDMVDGRSQTIPILGTKLLGSYTIADSIKRLREDPLVKSVVLRIESGGGSSMAADVMWRELELLKKKKPLIVSMGSIAASGGYYIAAPAKTIYALPLTVTGSIGIFYGKADISGLLQKIGVNVETYKTSPRADAESMYRAYTDDERKALKIKIQQFYDVFLDRVAEGRNMKKEDVDAVGQGRVWTGQEALQHKLVDKLGGLRDAMNEARRLGKLPDDAPLVEEPPSNSTLLDKVLKIAGFGLGSTSIPGIALTPIQLLRSATPLLFHDADKPLARVDWVSDEMLHEPTESEDAAP